MKTSELYAENACCGCSACVVACPKNAISMTENIYGFTYPKINEDLCINCNICKNTCAFQTEKQNNKFSCYACVNKDEHQIMKSASGGAFSAIATSFLEKGGYVCGAVAAFKNGTIDVKHQVINDIKDLDKLQGSKYVQSNTKEAFQEVLTLLNNGKRVLFSGTPCQVDAIKRLCKNYVDTTLYTIDIICHGVPSQKIFNSYLQEYQKLCNSQLTYIDFRNKKYGWGLTGIAKFIDKPDKTITPQTSSYYKYFLEGEIYRDSCYNCPYANLKRVGDITIGDYWGIQQLSPELLHKKYFSEEKGVSCLIVNNVKGEKIIENHGSKLSLYPVDIEKVMVINTQLKESSKYTEKRTELLNKFYYKGYSSIEKSFQRKLFYSKCKTKIKSLFPKKMRSYVKKIIQK